MFFCPIVQADSEISWNTFLGSSSDDYGYSVAADGSGNLYITVYGNASWGTPVNAYSGNHDAFVAKIYDLDVDDDGWPSDSGGCPYDLFQNNPGTCGCGVPDRDKDSDGIADSLISTKK